MKDLLLKIGKLVQLKTDIVGRFYDPSEISNDWLGYEPATMQDIIDKEKKLGIHLPTSYKAFLLVTNGFKQVLPSFGKLLPVNKIGWLKDREQDLIDAFSDHSDFDHYIKDEDLLWNEKGDSGKWRFFDFKNTLVISDWADSSLLLLNPNSHNKEDYELWEFANWYPGCDRHENFKKYLEYCLTDLEEMDSH